MKKEPNKNIRVPTNRCAIRIAFTDLKIEHQNIESLQIVHAKNEKKKTCSILCFNYTSNGFLKDISKRLVPLNDVDIRYAICDMRYA